MWSIRSSRLIAVTSRSLCSRAESSKARTTPSSNARSKRSWAPWVATGAEREDKAEVVVEVVDQGAPVVEAEVVELAAEVGVVEVV